MNWCCNIDGGAEQNYDTAFRRQVWGAKDPSIFTAKNGHQVMPGDWVLFVFGARFLPDLRTSRMKSEEWMGEVYTADAVMAARVTRGPHKDYDPIFSGPSNYPYRIVFDIEHEVFGVPIYRELPESILEQVRLSMYTNGRMQIIPPIPFQLVLADMPAWYERYAFHQSMAI